MNRFQNKLAQNKLNVEKLKNNIHLWSLQKLIDDLRADWNPKMKTISGKAYSGADPEIEPEDMLYWDVANAKWTYREEAFRSYICSFLNELTNKPMNKTIEQPTPTDTLTTEIMVLRERVEELEEALSKLYLSDGWLTDKDHKKVQSLINKI